MLIPTRLRIQFKQRCRRCALLLQRLLTIPKDLEDKKRPADEDEEEEDEVDEEGEEEDAPEEGCNGPKFPNV